MSLKYDSERLLWVGFHSSHLLSLGHIASLYLAVVGPHVAHVPSLKGIPTVQPAVLTGPVVEPLSYTVSHCAKDCLQNQALALLGGREIKAWPFELSSSSHTIWVAVLLMRCQTLLGPHQCLTPGEPC